MQRGRAINHASNRQGNSDVYAASGFLNLRHGFLLERECSAFRCTEQAFRDAWPTAVHATAVDAWPGMPGWRPSCRSTRQGDAAPKHAAHGGARMEDEQPAGACVDAIHRQATGLTGLSGLPHRPQRLSSFAAPSEAGLRCLTAFGPAGLARRHGAPEGPAPFEPGRCPVQAPLQKQIFHDLDRETGSIAQLARPASKIRPEAGTPRRMQNAAIQPAGASFRSRYSP